MKHLIFIVVLGEKKRKSDNMKNLKHLIFIVVLGEKKRKSDNMKMIKVI